MATKKVSNDEAVLFDHSLLYEGDAYRLVVRKTDKSGRMEILLYHGELDDFGTRYWYQVLEEDQDELILRVVVHALLQANGVDY